MNGFANVINRYYVKRCFVFLRIPNAEYKEIAFYKDIGEEYLMSSYCMNVFKKLMNDSMNNIISINKQV